MLLDLVGKNVTLVMPVIESLKSKKLYNYMNSKNKYGYPYFWLKKQFK